LTLFIFGSDCFEKLEKRFTFVAEESVFSQFIEPGEKGEKSPAANKEEKVPLLKVFRLFLWLTCLTFALRYLNYIAVATVFIFLLIALEAKAGLFRALIVAASVGLFIFVLFGTILKVNFQV
jgi:hypothetical protein